MNLDMFSPLIENDIPDGIDTIELPKESLKIAQGLTILDIICKWYLNGNNNENKNLNIYRMSKNTLLIGQDGKPIAHIEFSSNGEIDKLFVVNLEGKYEEIKTDEPLYTKELKTNLKKINEMIK